MQQGKQYRCFRCMQIREWHDDRNLKQENKKANNKSFLKFKNYEESEYFKRNRKRCSVYNA